MALVPYDNDSSSEHEEEEEEVSCVIVKNKNESSESNNENQIKEGDSITISKLLSVLPKKKSSTVINESKIEDFIPKWQPVTKPKNEKVKISIPSLSQFEDEELSEPKRVKLTTKNSSLLSLLPPVRGSPLTNKSFVPKVLSQKPSQTAPKSLVPNALRKKAELERNAVLKRNMKKSESKAGSDMESDDEIELPETFDEEMWQKVCGRPKQKNIVQDSDNEISTTAATTQIIDLAPEPVKPYDGLDNAAFKELIGKSKRPQNIKLVDINEEEVVPDKDVWLTKSLTDPEQAPKPVIDDPVDPTRKKKHHITYLAEQAKANEQDFKNQWAASKYTRNQTRAKYGF